MDIDMLTPVGSAVSSLRQLLTVTPSGHPEIIFLLCTGRLGFKGATGIIFSFF